MKRIVITLILAIVCQMGFAQSCYWVFLTDKQGTTFDPYSYFDSKAIERYSRNDANLYDISNFPLNGSYVSQIDALAIEEVGQSRWLNAMAVMATPDQIAQIQELPFVSRTQLIASNMQLAQADSVESSQLTPNDSARLTDQLIRMQGQGFVKNNITGKGIRIAVLDGGFPSVDKHPAFKHLRDNNRIIDTWNFPNKKADVYGWSSHGCMTLSCITGLIGNLQLGLATESEFLLYRTEVELEPFKEEVWWMMAMERADQQGADIISSSLGYGKERYYTTDMDGTSYVAKAANMAVEKGILVCNSAGNEGTDKQWRTIVTPSDAENVLCVGGTEASLTKYRHINFSSFGPSADGRMKPNVSAYGYATVADPSGYFTTAYGTSFACPLVAGFAACAWQTRPDLPAKEMKKAIEQSGDLYPYFDYALGYGVPQANFFLKDNLKKEPTFVFRDSVDRVIIEPIFNQCSGTFMFNKQLPDGSLVTYCTPFDVQDISPTNTFFFYKNALDSCTLNVWFNGYSASYKLPDDFIPTTPNNNYTSTFYPRRYPENVKNADITNYAVFASQDSGPRPSFYSGNPDRRVSNLGSCAKWRKDIYFMYGDNFGATVTDDNLSPWSPSVHLGFRFMRALSKPYSIGIGFEYNWSHYNYDKSKINTADEQLGLTNVPNITKKRLNIHQFDFELFQRVRFVPGGLTCKGWHWDLGVFAGWNFANRYRIVQEPNDGITTKQTTKYKLDAPLSDYQFVFGAITRISYDWIGIYLRYESPMVHSKCGCNIPLPDLQVGIQFCF